MYYKYLKLYINIFPYDLTEIITISIFQYLEQNIRAKRKILLVYYKLLRERL